MNDDFGFIQVSEPRHIAAIEGLLASKGTFVTMADGLSLDRETDFQRSDLRGVDFTNSDLRGFNFSGADLRGSFGLNITFDETTRLDGADVDSSPFSHVLLERSVRGKDAGFEREYDLLRKAYWADQLPYVVDRIKRSNSPVDARLMAMRLITDAKSSVVRGDMVRALGYVV